MKHEWLKISNKTNDSADIKLDGFISMDENSSAMFDSVLTPLEQAGIKNANLSINCYGGSCAMGIAINDRIDRSSIKIQKVVTGIAASMGAVIAIGKETQMTPYSKLMLHKPSGAVAGSAKDMRAAADLTDRYEATLIQMIADKTGLHADLIRLKYFKEGEDIWLNATESVDAGLVKSVTPAKVNALVPSNWMEMDVAASWNFIKDKTSDNHNSNQNHLDMDFKKIAVAAGLNDSATEADVISALGKMKDLSAANATLTEEKTKLSEKLTAAESAKTTAEAALAVAETSKVETLVDAAVSAGKIVAKQKEHYVKLAKLDFESTKGILDGLAPKKDLIDALKKEGAGAAGADDARANWTYEGWSKKDPNGLAKMRIENKEKFEELFNAQYKTA